MADEGLTIEKRDDGVAIVRMDIPGEPMNTLKDDFVETFTEVFNAVENDADIKAVVFTSGKKDSFIAGADVTMLETVNSAEEGERISLEGHKAMARIESFGKPVVAAIHGVALGGGLEVALACHARVASDSKKTKLGLPESQLGLIPGAGGTQRLPRLIGVQPALDMMLTGKQVDAKKARKLGLVDDVVPPLDPHRNRGRAGACSGSATRPSGTASSSSFATKTPSPSSRSRRTPWAERSSSIRRANNCTSRRAATTPLKTSSSTS